MMLITGYAPTLFFRSVPASLIVRLTPDAKGVWRFQMPWDLSNLFTCRSRWKRTDNSGGPIAVMVNSLTQRLSIQIKRFNCEDMDRRRSWRRRFAQKENRIHWFSTTASVTKRLSGTNFFTRIRGYVTFLRESLGTISSSVVLFDYVSEVGLLERSI